MRFSREELKDYVSSNNYESLADVDRGEPYQIGEPMKTKLEDAIALASRMHYGDRDKVGAPYILHAIRVMMKGKSFQEMIVGVLHDVVEDTPVTVDEIKLRFGEEISSAVDCISKRKFETNEDYILRVKSNPLARAVKIHDLEDNTSLERMAGLPPDVQKRLGYKYARAIDMLYAKS